MSTRVPRGVRNHNPLNLVHGQKWLGLAKTQTDPKFCQFIEPLYGIRAGARTLFNYGKKHKIDCVDKVIRRWSETDQDTYIAAVCKATGFGPRQPIRLSAPHVLAALIPAMIQVECGQWTYPKDLIARAIAMALEV